MTNTLTPRQLFDRGFDTMHIARLLGQTEAAVYNNLGLGIPMPAAKQTLPKPYVEKVRRSKLIRFVGREAR